MFGITMHNQVAETVDIPPVVKAVATDRNLNKWCELHRAMIDNGLESAIENTFAMGESAMTYFANRLSGRQVRAFEDGPMMKLVLTKESSEEELVKFYTALDNIKERVEVVKC